MGDEEGERERGVEGLKIMCIGITGVTAAAVAD